MYVKVSTEHSIRILEFLARDEGKLYSAQTLSNALDIPLPFFMKIVSLLKKAKMVKTVQGRSGGFLLAKKADKITIFDVMKAAENDYVIAPCLESGAKKFKGKNEIKPYFDGIQTIVEEKLKSTTIRDLVSEPAAK